MLRPSWSVDVHEHVDSAVARVAGAIGEPARTRMLFCLMDGHARTSTELAVVADVAPPTASAHLNRLKAENLIKVLVQGRHRYYSLAGPHVATALEGLSVLANGSNGGFVPRTPSPLRAARSCYDHMAGTVAVALHDRFVAADWIRGDSDYKLTNTGAERLGAVGIDLVAIRALRRKFAYSCLDWSERRPHIGGALGAGLLGLFLKRRWMVRDFNSRALTVTALGRREVLSRFGVRV